MSSVENSPVAGQVGRKLILSGAILMGLSVLLGLVGTKLTLGQFSTAQLTRDVVINGSSNPKVPGKLSFEVAEPLQESSPQEAEMRVGIAVEYEQLPAPVCTMTDESGAEVPLSSSGGGEALLGDSSGKFTVMGSALLAPGEYEAICTLDKEPSSSSASFTVGRVFGMDDLSGTFAPFLWFLAVGFVCGLMFLVGMILTIVGLVKRSKSNKSGPGLPTAGVSGSGAAAGVVLQFKVIPFSSYIIILMFIIIIIVILSLLLGIDLRGQLLVQHVELHLQYLNGLTYNLTRLPGPSGLNRDCNDNDGDDKNKYACI